VPIVIGTPPTAYICCPPPTVPPQKLQLYTKSLFPILSYLFDYLEWREAFNPTSISCFYWPIYRVFCGYNPV